MAHSLRRQGGRRLGRWTSALAVVLAALATMLVTAGSAAATTGSNIITDGMFNDTSSPYAPSSGSFTELSANDASATGLPGWTVTNNSVDWENALQPGPSPGDDYAVDMNGNAPGTLAQTVSDTAGQAYLLTFQLNGNADCGGSSFPLQVDWNGAAAASYVGSTSWNQESAVVTGTGSDTLSFVSQTPGACGPVIADVSLQSVTDATSTSVSCAAASLVSGQHTQCTATVTDTDSSPITPTGTVTFTSNRPGSSFTGNPCTLSATSSSTASCSVTFVAGTAKATITGTYSGDAAHTGSSGTTTVGSAKRTTSTVLDCPPDTVAIGSSLTCTATVTDSTTGTFKIRPTGTVTFKGNLTDQFDPTSCTLQPVNGQSSSCSVQYTPTAGPNHHKLTAHYSGDLNHTGSTGSVTVMVTS